MLYPLDTVPNAQLSQQAAERHAQLAAVADRTARQRRPRRGLRSLLARLA